jgi:hypothetical protein
MKDNKNFKWIYEPTDYGLVIKYSIVIVFLFLLTMSAQYYIVSRVAEEHRIYDPDSKAEKEWYETTSRNMKRPMDKKINL